MINEDWKLYGEWVLECERGTLRQTECGALTPGSAAWVHGARVGEVKSIRFEYKPRFTVVGPVDVPADGKVHYFRRCERENGILKSMSFWIGWRKDNGEHYYRSIDAGTGQTHDDVHP